MWLENPKTLKLRGYVGFLYETEIWTKALWRRDLS
jgi:hypothetical protein